MSVQVTTASPVLQISDAAPFTCGAGPLQMNNIQELTGMRSLHKQLINRI